MYARLRSVDVGLAKTAAPLLAASAAATLIAGCGGGSDADVGPAEAVPASAPVYIEATVRPEGAAADDANAALGKILDTPDAGAKLVTLIEQESAQEGDTVDFEQDVSPWLGERVGVFFSNFEDESDGAIVAESKDNDAALQFFSSLSSATGRKATYEDHEYEFDDDGDVFGAVGDFIVSGSEEGFKQAVDASGGDALGDSDQFKDSIDELPEDSLGVLYALPKNILDAIPEEEINAAQRAIVEKTAGDAVDEPILGDITASAEDIEIELSSGGGDVETPQSSLLEQLPAQAWLGIGFGNLGEVFKRGLEGVQNANVPGADEETIRSQVQAATGLELDQIIDSLGNGAIYFEGTSEATLMGALVLQTEDPETTSTLLTKLQSLIQQSGDPKEVKVQPLASATGEVGFQLIDPSGQLKQPVQFVQKGDKVVIGYGSASVTQVLQGEAGQTLSGVPGYSSAADKLSGLGVDAFLSFAPVFQLAESAGAAKDPEYLQAKPYIDGLDYLAVGSGSEDERALIRFIVGLN